MKFSVCLIIVLLLTISHFTVHSVPIRDMVEEQQSVKVTRREANTITQDSLKMNDFARELTKVSLPSYLKELYINCSLSGGSINVVKYGKMVKADTIWSFKNQARGEFIGNLLLQKYTCKDVKTNNLVTDVHNPVFCRFKAV